ncbi:agmatine deiminase family protein [Embleya hyalina]|uniref:Porphyromonas-type peptidyl-arginine deiminase n=1 Tax=Embleya hyalina TaxID=516124 RepID=A0A401YTH8_9ACTN|nr:agmatine deiminase family protein [Embleya hyalina]GCD97879.1 Porphyromonas-type peptidyl-arginine deiminase [Embleya hyalina]
MGPARAHVDRPVRRRAASGVVLPGTAFPGGPADSRSRAGDRARSVPKSAVDARGEPFEVVDLPQPDPDLITCRGHAFASGCADFSVADGAPYMPRFGDERADDPARRIFRDHCFGRDVVPVPIGAIASGGGGVHCATHDRPAAPAPE